MREKHDPNQAGPERRRPARVAGVGGLLLAGLVLAGLVAAAYVIQPGFFRVLEGRVYDRLLAAMPASEPTGAVVLVDIDEASLAAHGQWPWPRYRVALLLDGLRKAGAAAVGLDILFAEPDRSSPELLRRELARDLGVDLDLSGLPEGLDDFDALLAPVLASGPFVLGYSFDFSAAPHTPPADAIQDAAGCPPHPLKTVLLSAPGSPPLEQCMAQAPGVVCPLPALAGAAPGAGYFNTLADGDGIVRRLPLVLLYEGRTYPSLALAAYMQATGLDQAVLKLTSGGVESLRLGPDVIPLDRHGALLLHYRDVGRGKGYVFETLSAAQVLDGKLPADALAGRIVLVGSSAAGLKDLKATPFERLVPGMAIQATALDTLLAGDWLVEPDWAPGLHLVLIAVCGVVITLGLAWAGPWVTVLVAALAALGIWQGALALLTHEGLYISPLPAWLTLAVLFPALVLLKFRREESRRRFFHQAFAHYVAPAVVDELARRPERLTLGGEEREVSILFADIRGFTSISEALAPEQVAALLHDFFTPMTAAVTSAGGTLDKFLGDGLLAFWNAPLAVPDHQARALGVALAMQARLAELAPHFVERFGHALRMGVGLHTGPVRVGNMGSRDLFDYTIIGDAVNLASRLEGLTRFYGVDLLVSEQALDAALAAWPDDHPPRALAVDTVRVRGKAAPVRVFTVVDPDACGEGRIADFEAAMILYGRREFQAAAEKLDGLLQQPDCGSLEPLFHVWLERCRGLAADPPGEDWDGVADPGPR